MPHVITAALVVALVGCGGAPVAVAPGRDGDFAARIDDAATWQALAARVGSETLARVEVVKVILDRDGDRLYFTQSRRWPIHFDFAARFITWARTAADQRAFNDREYHAADRRFVLGTITRYLDQARWTFELAATDTLALDATARAFERIRGAVYFGAALRYRPISGAHLRDLAAVRARLPVVTTDELFAGISYQPIELGDAFGTLRVIPAGQPLPGDLGPDDVVVLGTQPLELPPVAAIITDELQAPLGHLAVLAHSRGTPDMARRGASTLAEVVALAGKLVHVRVGAGDYAIRLATPDERARAPRRAHHEVPRLRLDLTDPGLPALATIDPGDTARFGAKTAQLARVARLGGIATPRAFGLPFAAYARFLAASGIDRKIAALLASPRLRGDPRALRAELAAIRDAIAVAAIPPALTDAVRARIAAVLAGSPRVRLRSSTNAEDLDGFSGAGLYRSATIDPASRADLERGLREVWASVWSYEAFAERAWYGIDHARVAMAILVQESIDDDVVNGVAITGNPYFEGRPAIYVNAQRRGGSVTGAAGDEVPEQVLSYTAAAGVGIERISESSRARGSQLLSDAEITALAVQLARIHTDFTSEPVGSAAAVDVEFLLRGDRRIVIVQARPYTMRWLEDRHHAVE